MRRRSISDIVRRYMLALASVCLVALLILYGIGIYVFIDSAELILDIVEAEAMQAVGTIFDAYEVDSVAAEGYTEYLHDGMNMVRELFMSNTTYAIIACVGGLLPLLLLAFGGYIVISKHLSKRLSRTILRVVEDAERIGMGNLDYQVRVGDYDSIEIEQLAGELNNMVVQLKALFIENESVRQNIEIDRIFRLVLGYTEALICAVNPETYELVFVSDSMLQSLDVRADYEGKLCYKTLYGFSEKCKGCPCEELVDTETDEIIWECHNECGGREFRNHSRLVEWIDGSKVHLRTSIDITEAKKGMAELREREQVQSILFRYAPVGLVIFKQNFKLIECNDRILEMFETDSDGFKEFFETLSFLPELQEDGVVSTIKAGAVVDRALQGEDIKLEWVHKTARGGLLPVELTLTSMTYKGERVCLAYVYDMSVQYALRNELEAAALSESKANRAKSEFLASMSHEMRTPLNSIIGNAGLILREESLSGTIVDRLSDIEESGRVLLGLINDILDLSKIESGKMDLNCAKYELCELLQRIIKVNDGYFKNKDINFTLIVDDKLPRYLYGDEVRVGQILSNLLSNAFKYTDEGAVSVDVNVLGERVVGGNVTLVFNVRDTGRGMTEEQLSKLFTEYTRVGEEDGKFIEGTGLGLSIVRRLVDSMRGRISVDSAVGEGSTFVVKIPQKFIDAKVISNAQLQRLHKLDFRSVGTDSYIESVTDFTGLEGRRVLVVDDIKTNIKVLEGLLSPYKMKIESCEDGECVIAKIKAGEVFDLIFMDYKMPGMDGIEVVEILRDIGYNKPIVALTANAIKGQSEIFIASGFDGYTTKPVDIKEIDGIMRRLIK